MPRLDQAAATKRKHVLIFGPPKTGKSELVSKLAHKHKLLWNDGESGSDVLFKLPPEAQQNVELIRYPDSYSQPVLVDSWLKLVKGANDRVCYEHGKFRCPACQKLPDYEAKSDPVNMLEQRATNRAIVVFDSITQMVASCKAYIGKGKPDDYKFEFDDWAKLGKLMEMFLSEIQAAPYDIVCIAHEIEVEMVDGKNKIVPGTGTTNFSRSSAKWFDEVIYTQVNNKKHSAASATTWQNQIQTGSRSDFDISKLEVPSLDTLFEHRLVNAG